MLKTLKRILECPTCHGLLVWKDEVIRDEVFLVSASAKCSKCLREYFIEDEIAYFLTDLTRNDLWKENNSGLVKFLNRNPELYNKLMTARNDSLAPADLFFKSMILEDQSDFSSAEILQRQASLKIYTPSHLECSNKQINFVSNLKFSEDKFILDIASGKGYLVFKLLDKFKNHIIFTDFSPTIMKKNKKKLECLNLLDKASLIAFDARKTPFKDKSIDIMTTNQGLGNVEEPNNLLLEVKRILRGDFYSIMMFLPENDLEHAKYIGENKLSMFSFLDFTKNEFLKANFTIELLNICESHSKPTPEGEIIPSGIDGIPIHDTKIEWATIHAK